MSLEVNHWLTVPESELSWRFSPSGGPGGQHANKANTRAELQWRLVDSTAIDAAVLARLQRKLGPVVVVSVDDERSQARNRDIAKRRLAQVIREALIVDPIRRDTKPTAGSKRRRVEAKRKRSRDKRLRRRPGYDD